MSIVEGTSVVDDLPEVAKRYLAHAIAPSAALADTVDLEIEGSTMQKGRWFPFTAHERLEAGIGFHWAARLRYGPMVLRVSISFAPGRRVSTSACSDWCLSCAPPGPTSFARRMDASRSSRCGCPRRPIPNSVPAG